MRANGPKRGLNSLTRPVETEASSSKSNMPSRILLNGACNFRAARNIHSSKRSNDAMGREKGSGKKMIVHLKIVLLWTALLSATSSTLCHSSRAPKSSRSPSFVQAKSECEYLSCYFASSARFGAHLTGTLEAVNEQAKSSRQRSANKKSGEPGKWSGSQFSSSSRHQRRILVTWREKQQQQQRLIIYDTQLLVSPFATRSFLLPISSNLNNYYLRLLLLVADSNFLFHTRTLLAGRP